MSGQYRWSNPAMKTVSPAPDDPNRLFSIDAAGNKPPRDGLAALPRPPATGFEADTPETELYGDRSGED